MLCRGHFPVLVRWSSCSGWGRRARTSEGCVHGERLGQIRHRLRHVSLASESHRKRRSGCFFFFYFTCKQGCWFLLRKKKKKKKGADSYERELRWGFREGEPRALHARGKDRQLFGLR